MSRLQEKNLHELCLFISGYLQDDVSEIPTNPEGQKEYVKKRWFNLGMEHAALMAEVQRLQEKLKKHEIPA